MSDGWVRRPSGDISIIFVHGILSNNKKCWTHKNNSYWPQIATECEELVGCGVYAFEYKTGISSGSYGINDAVDSLKELWHLDGLKSQRSLIFVCHSMGGIIVRKFICERIVELKDAEIGLFLLGSPSLGSKLAGRLGLLTGIFGHKQGRMLNFVQNNPWLQDLHRSFKNLKEEESLSIRGKELIEDVAPWWLPGTKIVEGHSSAVYFGNPYKVPNSTHSSLAKIGSKLDIQHRLLKKFVSEFIPSQYGIGYGAEKPQKILKSDPLFEVFSRVNKKYYITRDVDSDFARRLLRSSIWVHGSSGVGKTSLVKNLIDLKDEHPIEISLSNLGRENSSDLVLREIVHTLRHRLNQPGAETVSQDEAVQLICRINHNATIFLFIDEVPIGVGRNTSPVLNTLSNLLDGAKRNGRHDAKFVVCSKIAPDADGNGRFLEQFQFFKVEKWTGEELRRLVDVCLAAIDELKVAENDIATLVEAAEGSPRFLKVAIRELKSMVEDEQPDVQRAIGMARQSLKGL